MTTLNQNKNIYHGSIKYKKKIFWFIPISITVTNLNISQPTYVLPYDIYGGGQQRTSSNQLPLSGITSNSFGFIPTASALDVGKWTTPINDGDYRRSFVGAQPPVAPKNSPFQNFVTGFVQNNPGASNSRHISFNTRNGNWLARELNPGPGNPIEVTDCSFLCNSNSTAITGPESICGAAGYSAPAGASSYSWSVTEGAGLVAITGNGTPNITLTHSGNGSGYVTIQITYGGSGCGSATLTKRIWVSAPQFRQFVFESGFQYSLCLAPLDYYLTYTLPSQNVRAVFDGMGMGAGIDSNWEWERENNLIMLNSTGDRAMVCPIQTGLSNFRVRARNACGWSEWMDMGWFTIDQATNNYFMSQAVNNVYTVFPNPSKDIVSIDLRDQNHPPQKGAVVSGELFDIMGQSKSKVQITGDKATFSVAHLDKGVYVLKIYIDGQVESHQIAVKAK
jgi:hypothetical protein